MARTTTAAKKKGKQARFSFFSDMTTEKKSAFYRYCGLAVAAFTLFTLASLVSYLFTWQADQSLLAHPDMIEKSVDVSNWGGKLGYRWSEFLLARCFGFGSFALVFLLGAVAFRLYFWNKSIGLLRTMFITVSGAFLASLVLSYMAFICGLEGVLGGGIGGDAGYAVVTSASNLIGPFATALLLIVLVVALLLVSNKKFAYWFAVDKEKTVTQEPAEENTSEDDSEN